MTSNVALPYRIESIEPCKKQIVRKLFVDTADDNYITARWCFMEGLNVDYFWLAVHALEKYMKAALLMNGRSSKSYRDTTGNCQRLGHDITILYEQVKLMCPEAARSEELLPGQLRQPQELDNDYWFDESPEDFLMRLYDNGNAHNRYQIFGFQQFYDSIFKFDKMVFALRRLCVPLDEYCRSVDGSNLRSDGRFLTYRDVLTNQPQHWGIRSGKLEKTMSGECGERLREVLLNSNFPFAPDDFPHGNLPDRMASQNPVLGHLILRPLEQASESSAVARASELCNWVLENIQLPGEVENQLRQALKIGSK